MAKRYAPFDALTAFAEDAVVTASGVFQNADSEDIVLKVGPGRYDAWLVIDLGAVKVSAADELYTFVLEGANTEAFDDEIATLFMIELGAADAMSANQTEDTAVGRFLFPVSNQLGDTEYEFVRLSRVVAGTSPSTTVTAWLSKHPGA